MRAFKSIRENMRDKLKKSAYDTEYRNGYIHI